MQIPESELILNDDGSIYHLNLRPEHLANTIITVGDPDRVEDVTCHFDHIEFKMRKREFHTQTGSYKGKRLTVISTGIGTDNIDIVFNELDALVNIDLTTRTVKEDFTQLEFVRIGTSGSIQRDIPIDCFLISAYAVGFDSLLHFYENEFIQHKAVSDALVKHTNWCQDKSMPYVVQCDDELLIKMRSNKTVTGFTATNVGFYGPQGRKLRLKVQDDLMNEKLASFKFNDLQLTNLEMETAGIYGMSKLLGHKAISMNAILANRATGEFSDDPKQIVDQLIVYTLNRLI